MPTKLVLFAIAAATVAVALAVVVPRWTATAKACGDPAPAAQPSPAPDTCSLDSDARGRAIDELAAFSADYLADVRVTATASFHGDPDALHAFLAPAIEREAACCSFLERELVRTAEGYDVVMAGDRAALVELTAALGALAQP